MDILFSSMIRNSMFIRNLISYIDTIRYIMKSCEYDSAKMHNFLRRNTFIKNEKNKKKKTKKETKEKRIIRTRSYFDASTPQVYDVQNILLYTSSVRILRGEKDSENREYHNCIL
jgi:hypothetical protein